jgi:hypothetical protein
LAAPLLAQVQPYNPNDQYGSPAAQQIAQQDPQYGGPPAGAPQDNGYPMQNGAPQAGAPQGIEQAPPAIPDYAQPPAPGDGYIWTPGYWAWSGDGYEWVQGAWVAAPYTGALWTPGYWGSGYDGYFWNTGYWGPYVGYYGGINYGFGYFGIGFYGGYWGGGRFFYNRAYCNIGRGWNGGNYYNRSYNGYSGHPGGTSFTHVNNVAYNRGAGVSSGVRSSSINGRNFAQTSAVHSNYNSVGANASRGYNGASAYNGASRSYAQPAQSHVSNYAGNNGGSSYHAAAPSSSYSGGGAYHGGSYGGGGGGGYHGSGGGGGGGSHGGGGGGHR